MILNILDTPEKKKVLTEYRLRLAVISVSAIGVIASASLLLLLPPYLLAASKYNNAKKEVDALELKNGGGTQEKQIGAQIRAINDEVAVLVAASTPTKNIPLPSVAIENILKIKSSGIKITSISYDAGVGQQRIVLVGSAATRDGLATFVDALKKDPTYSNVALPISSYVKSTNIDFSIALDAKPKPAPVKTSSPGPGQPF